MNLQIRFLVLTVALMTLTRCGGEGHAPLKPRTTSAPPVGASGAGARSIGASDLSYDNGIKQILSQRCTPCHAAGGGLANWQDFDTVSAKKDLIFARVVAGRTMPPPAVSTITDKERELLGAWIKEGAQKSASAGSDSGTGSDASGTTSPGSTEPVNPHTATVTSQSTSAPDFSSVQDKLAACTGCHGTGGNSSIPIFPKLAGQQASYIEQELHAFKNKTRQTPEAKTQMWPQAEGLSDAQIKLLAEYFAGQKRAVSMESTAGLEELIKQGEDLYRNGIASKQVPACISCHGPSAEGSALAPALAGQHKAYFLKQLHAFNSGGRPDAKMMPAFSRNITPEAAEALGTFLQFLP